MAIAELERVVGRNKDGELLPILIEVSDFGGEVLLIPLTKGELNELQEKYGGKNTFDAEELSQRLVNPKVTAEQITDMPVKNQLALSAALLAVSTGLSYEKASSMLLNGIEEQVEQVEEFVKKKRLRTSETSTDSSTKEDTQSSTSQS